MYPDSDKTEDNGYDVELTAEDAEQLTASYLATQGVELDELTQD